MTNGKKDILIIMGRYLPGYKDGGPVRSIKNLVAYLGEEYNFKIFVFLYDLPLAFNIFQYTGILGKVNSSLYNLLIYIYKLFVICSMYKENLSVLRIQFLLIFLYSYSMISSKQETGDEHNEAACKAKRNCQTGTGGN